MEGEGEEGTLKVTYSDSSISLAREARPVEMKLYITYEVRAGQGRAFSVTVIYPRFVSKQQF